MGLASVNILVEIIVTMLPVPIIWRLKLDRRERLGVILLLSIGVIVVGISAAKLYYIWLTLIGTYDQTWWTSPLWICVKVELDVGIVSSSFVPRPSCC